VVHPGRAAEIIGRSLLEVNLGSETILLDTHVFLLWLNDQQLLLKAARSAIGGGKNTKHNWKRVPSVQSTQADQLKMSRRPERLFSRFEPGIEY
jgi:hypothetical protein